MIGLSNDNLLRSFYLEAGLWSYSGNGGTTTASSGQATDGPEQWHWGWEAITCELRGHMMGHWLSAAAQICARNNDRELAAKAAIIVEELARCQQANGGHWLAAFPEKFMHRLSAGKWVWAPHYTLHKLLMGLLDMHRLTGNAQALSILEGMAQWFDVWSERFSQDEMDEILDMETGGMLEAWAELYAVTGAETHRRLMLRYVRRRFFDRLVAGEDVLTNKHANTQIPEILGAARMYEVTREPYYRQVVEAFWRSAVSERGYVCTGAGDDGELWMPKQAMAARLGVGQEHCCNYNMMRLADVLLRWTGDTVYADYWERRFVNGVLAHQHAKSGMITYFLGVAPGSVKKWGSPTQHFWCCHGTLIQANAAYDQQVFLQDDEGVAVMQWMAASATLKLASGKTIGLAIRQDGQYAVHPLNRWSTDGMEAITRVDRAPLPTHRPDCYRFVVTVDCERAERFTLRLRLPWWLAGPPKIMLNNQALDGCATTMTMATGQCAITRDWQAGDELSIEMPTALRTEALPGESGTVAFMEGPVVLAGLCDHERELICRGHAPETLLRPERERNHSWWQGGFYRTHGQGANIRFVPLYEVDSERYSVYFPLQQN